MCKRRNQHDVLEKYPMHIHMYVHYIFHIHTIYVCTFAKKTQRLLIMIQDLRESFYKIFRRFFSLSLSLFNDSRLYAHYHVNSSRITAAIRKAVRKDGNTPARFYSGTIKGPLREAGKKVPTKEPEEMGHVEEQDVIKHATRSLIRSA